MKQIVYKITRESDGHTFEVVKYSNRAEILSWHESPAYYMSACTFENCLPPLPDVVPPFRNIWEAVKYAKEKLEFLY